MTSLPTDEETAVTAEVVNGVIEAANRNTSETSAENDQLLFKTEHEGFNGETRGGRICKIFRDDFSPNSKREMVTASPVMAKPA